MNFTEKKQLTRQFINTEKANKKFSTNTLKNLCNNYFKSDNFSVKFNIIKSDKIKEGQVIKNSINLANIKELNLLRKLVYEQTINEEFNNKHDAEFKKNLSKKILNPVLHTCLEFLENQENIKPENFVNLCESLGIQNKKETSFYNKIIGVIDWFYNNQNLNVKIFNKVFSVYYQTIFDSKNIHSMYLQKSPLYLNEILQMKYDNFDITSNEVIEKILAIHKTKSTKKTIFTQKYQKLYLNALENKEKLNLRIIDVELRPEINKIYYDLSNTYNLITKLNQFKNSEDYKKYVDEFNKICNEVEQIKLNLDKIKKTIDKNKIEIQTSAFVKVLFYIINFYKRFNTKKVIVSTIATIRKQTNINFIIKNEEFKNKLIEITEDELDGFIEEFNDYLTTLTERTEINYFDYDTYNTIGFYVYNNMDKSIKLYKSIRIAVGLCLMSYIINETEKITYSKKNNKITNVNIIY